MGRNTDLDAELWAEPGAVRHTAVPVVTGVFWVAVSCLHRGREAQAQGSRARTLPRGQKLGRWRVVPSHTQLREEALGGDSAPGTDAAGTNRPQDSRLRAVLLIRSPWNPAASTGCSQQ